uniref:Uncharacterized protein n=1 Tax=Timema poppense TaxID=170557 RepID=A0A7R9H3N3_TIMPO|nr:unnamed protein product [Timema poppensis]
MIKITKAAITNSGLLPLNTSEAVNHIPGKCIELKLTFSCMMDLSKFPLDSQVCTMEVASYLAQNGRSVSKTIEELSLEWKTMNPVIMGKGLRMPQFEIVKIAASDCQESFQIGNYSCLVAEFHLTRSVGFHLVQSYLPTILIVIISWVSFWMDVDSVPGRTTLGVTTLLAVSSQSSALVIIECRACRASEKELKNGKSGLFRYSEWLTPGELCQGHRRVDGNVHSSTAEDGESSEWTTVSSEWTTVSSVWTSVSSVWTSVSSVWTSVSSEWTTVSSEWTTVSSVWTTVSSVWTTVSSEWTSVSSE